ncbi:hypothetical protein QBE52_03185 [Clostridiaceae bacterium 35-E11]
MFLTKSYRYKIGKELEVLTDLNLYNEFKKNKNKEYIMIAQLMQQMDNFTAKYPRIKNFLWELWAYGFEIGPSEHAVEDEEVNRNIKEKIKLIDLLLGTHYWN